jgi:hypothetical protein
MNFSKKCTGIVSFFYSFYGLVLKFWNLQSGNEMLQKNISEKWASKEIALMQNVQIKMNTTCKIVIVENV